MDPQLPAQLVQFLEFLAPFLPYLVKGTKLARQEETKRPETEQ